MPGVGGGVCQFATTLFNAVFFAGLRVVERHPHQFAIDHYPLGRDAAVSWGADDFRFRNDTGHALMVRCWATKDSLTVVIVGTTGRTVTYDTSPMTQIRQPAHRASDPRVVYDGTVSKGITRWESGAPGYTITVEAHGVAQREGALPRPLHVDLRAQGLDQEGRHAHVAAPARAGSRDVSTRT